MKKCPYCTSDIPDEALKCKYCGEWVTRNANASEARRRSQKGFFESDNLGTTLNEGIKLYAKYKIIAFVIGLILFLIMLFGVILPQFRRVHKGFDKFRSPRIHMERSP